MESSEELNTILVIVLGSLGMLVLAAFIIIFVVLYQKRALQHENSLKEKEHLFQKKLLAATIEVAEAERAKIAGNIHDDVGIALNVLKLNFTKIKRNKENGTLLEELLDTNTDLLEDTIITIRSISHDLMPATLVKLGFIKGISELCRQISASGTTQVNLICNETNLVLDKKTELHLYRLIKEILNNVIKHAESSFIEVNIYSVTNKLVMNVNHNGKGINNEEVCKLIESNQGIGLKSILSRAQLTDSSVNYISNTNESKVTIETPLYAQQN